MSLPENLPPTIPSTASPNPVTPPPNPHLNPLSFKVRFGTGTSYKKIAPNSFSFHGKGELGIESQFVHIRGKRHRPFWFGVPEQHSFSRDDITNARSVGRYVRFEVINQPQARTLQVGFIARNSKEAAKIVGLLPRQQSEAFTQERAELEEYQQRLKQLTPRTWVTPSIVGINVLIFVLMCVNGVGVFVSDARMAIDWGSNFGPLTIVERQWWRLFTATFVHFGILHLTFNMLALYQSGRLVERIFGSVRFAALYLFAGLTGSLVSILWHPLVNSAGASGAIFGVFGALLVFMLNPRNAVPRAIVNEHRYSTTTFIAYNLMNGFTHGGIDNGAHIGGLLGGMAMGYLLARPLDKAAQGSNNVKRIIVAATVGILILGLLTYQLDQSKGRTAQALADLLKREQEKAPKASSSTNTNHRVPAPATANSVLSTATISNPAQSHAQISDTAQLPANIEARTESAHVMSAFMSGRSAAVNVEIFYREHQHFPATLQETHFFGRWPPTVKNIEINPSGTIVVTMADQPVANQQLYLEPTVRANQNFIWRCVNASVDARYLPRECTK